MSFEKLLDSLYKEGKIKKQETDVSYLNGLLSSAHQNLLSAKYNLDGGFYETAFKSAYDGLLQISKVILLLNGYRTANGEQHKTTFLVAGFILGKDFENLINKIDKYRVKRNKAIYQPVGIISKNEAENILKTSKDFWEKTRIYLSKKSLQLELFKF